MREAQQTSLKQERLIQVERFFDPNYQAMLAALRVVLQLPRTPTPLDQERKK